MGQNTLGTLGQQSQQQQIYDQLNSDPSRKRAHSYKTALQHLSLCGQNIKVEIHCKHCEEEHRENSILDKKIIRRTCGLRYCNHLHCQITRYARIFESLRSISRLKNLRKMWHYALGFEPIDIIQFQEKRKLFEKVFTSFQKRITKRLAIFGLHKIQAFKFLDFAREKDGRYYMHYHFLAIPYKPGDQRIIMKIFQDQRKKSIKKYGIPFHCQFFGNKSKLNLLSYMAKRCSGLYKPEEKPTDFIKGSINKLRDQILNHEFMILPDFLDFQEYFDLLYKKRLYATIGGMPYGSIVVDNISGVEGYKCPFHGSLDRKEIRMRFIEPDPPDPGSRGVEIEVIRIDSHICGSCGLEFSSQEHQDKTPWNASRDPESKLCPYCYYKGTKEYRQEKRIEAFDLWMRSRIRPINLNSLFE